MAFVHNTDLLLTTKGQEDAERLWPECAWVFAGGHLSDKFNGKASALAIDQEANRAKRKARRAGSFGITLAAVALMAAAAEPAYHEFGWWWPWLIPLVASVLGIVGVLITFFGVLHANNKSKWLSSRLITERLRQHHFQFIAAHLPAIARACDEPKLRPEILATRDREMGEIMVGLQGTGHAALRRVLEDEGDDRFWQSGEPERTMPAAEPAGALWKLVAAYRFYRVDKQFNFAAEKLSPGRTLEFKSPAKQRSILGNVTLISIVGILLLHVWLALSLALSGPPEAHAVGDEVIAEQPVEADNEEATHEGINPWFHIGVVWLALVALAAKTFEEGLRPGEEIGRYSSYANRMSSAGKEFDRIQKENRFDEIIDLMLKVERASYHELREFMRTHAEARFTM